MQYFFIGHQYMEFTISVAHKIIVATNDPVKNFNQMVNTFAINDLQKSLSHGELLLA